MTDLQKHIDAHMKIYGDPDNPTGAIICDGQEIILALQAELKKMEEVIAAVHGVIKIAERDRKMRKTMGCGICLRGALSMLAAALPKEGD